MTSEEDADGLVRRIITEAGLDPGKLKGRIQEKDLQQDFADGGALTEAEANAWVISRITEY